MLDAGLWFADGGQDDAVSVMVRPEDVRILRAGQIAECRLRAAVVDAIYLGSHIRCRLAVAGAGEVIVHAGRDDGNLVPIGAAVEVGWSRRDHRIVSA